MKFNQLLASDLAEFIRLRFGEDISLDSIAPELIPVLACQVDRPDWAFLMGEQLYGIGVLQPLNAAQTSCVQLRNPPGSQTLVTVEEVEIAAQATTTVTLGVLYNQTDLAGGPTTTIPRDTRLPGGVGGIAVLTKTNNIASANEIRRVNLIANTPWLWRPELVIAPGQCIRVTSIAINIDLAVGIRWRERRARPEELPN